MNLNLKTLGILLIVFSTILLITLSFVKTDVDTQSTFLCEKVQEKNISMSECPVHKSNISWMIVLAFGVGFLLFGIGTYLVLTHKKSIIQEETPVKKIDTSKLDADEKKVYDLLKTKEGGTAYQTVLVQETGYSKVKITRILDKLETKNIIERKRRGMTNLVVLK